MSPVFSLNHQKERQYHVNLPRTYFGKNPLASQSRCGGKGRPQYHAPLQVFLYVFDGIIEDCHSVAVCFVFQARPVRMLGWPDVPFRVGHKS